MATSLSASFTAGDTCPETFRRPMHPNQSIPPLRRERTSLDDELNRSTYLRPYNSFDLSQRSAAFSGEKQYSRRQLPTKLRSAKSHEIFLLIDRRLQTGVHGVRHMFRSNDPNQEGRLSKEAFRRVLMQLCGYINVEEWEKICKMFHLSEREDCITFEEFLSYFPSNEKAKRELSLAQLDRRSSSLLTLSQNLNAKQSPYKSYLTKLSANYCFSLMKMRCQDPSFTPKDYIPHDCLNGGAITRDHFERILENFQLADIILNADEFEKLWSKFDLDSNGMVRTNIFLRLLDYGANLADEIDANIQKLVSRPGAAGIVDRRVMSTSAATNCLSPSRRQRPSAPFKSRECIENDQQAKYLAPPPPTALDDRSDEAAGEPSTQPMSDDREKSHKVSSGVDPSTRELSTKFRTLVQQHRKMIKQLNENDEFLPFLDRKVNEGYFCLKTVFSYLDISQTNYITKEQLIAALNQFDIPLAGFNIDPFLQKHNCATSKSNNGENMIDYNAFLKHFQDRSESSFLARSLSSFHNERSRAIRPDFANIENGIIDLLHHTFLSITAAFKYIANDIEDLCPEHELFLILKKELNIPDSYQFTEKQKNELYSLLNSTEQMKQKRQLPYRRLLYYLTKTTIPMSAKERIAEKKEEHPIEKKQEKVSEKKDEQKPFGSCRKLSHIEKILNDLIRLRMHTFTKAFSRIDQPRTDKINKEQFYEVLQEMNTDLTQDEANLIWLSSGFHMDRSVPFANLIRKLVVFNRDENQALIQQLQRTRSMQDRQASSTARSIMTVSARAISSSGRMSDVSNGDHSIDCHEIYKRIQPQIRQNYNKIKNDLMASDVKACGLIDFSTLLNILNRYSVAINDTELGALVRLDNPRNGSKVQYPFFLRKYHPDGPIMKFSPWIRVHPIYEQLIHKHHEKYTTEEVYDQRTQNPRDLKYLIRLFYSYDKQRKGFLTSNEFHSLLRDNGINLNKSDEDYYQLYSKYDKQLRDQFNYSDLFRSMINTIMS